MHVFRTENRPSLTILYLQELISETTFVIIFFVILRLWLEIPRTTKNIELRRNIDQKTLSNGSEKYKMYKTSKKHLQKTLSNEADPYC
jgi:hypothetical protein